MSSYLAIIRDSFHEAFASKLLYVLLVLASLFLVCLLPISLTEYHGAYFGRTDIVSRTELIKKIKEQAGQQNASPGKRLWGKLPRRARERYQKIELEENDPDYPLREVYALESYLNNVLEDPEFYDPQAWNSVSLDDEAKELLASGIENLDAHQTARLNRLLIESAYPDLIRPAAAKDLHLGFFGSEISSPVPFKKKQLLDMAMSLFTDLLLGTFGILAAILITAFIIPQMFEAGSIDLLLSKPISRVGLFLSKFLGGCALIFLLSTYTIVGMWLICGLRFDYWNPGLFYCIPLMLFLFAIYYSVSAFFGVLWRNAILCVVMTVLFWAACWSLGTAKQGFETLALFPEQVMEITPAEKDFFVLSRSRTTQFFNTESQQWKDVFTNDATSFAFFHPRKSIAPVYDEKSQRLLAVLTIYDVKSGSSTQRIASASRDQDWSVVQGPEIPPGTAALFVTTQDDILLVGDRGIARLTASIEQAGEKGEAADQTFDFFGMQWTIPTVGDSSYITISPAEWTFPTAMALDQMTNRIAVCTATEIQIFEQGQDGTYRVATSKEFVVDRPSGLALAGDTLLLAELDGTIRPLDANTLEPCGDVYPGKSVPVNQIVARADGQQFAILFGNGELLSYRPEAGFAELKIDPGEQTSAIAINAENHLLVAHDYIELSEYSLESEQLLQEYSLDLNIFQWAYFYVVRPLYTVFPRPGELGNLVSYFVHGTEDISIDQPNGQQEVVKLDIKRPIYANLAFLIFMLAISCLYVWRRDF